MALIVSAITNIIVWLTTLKYTVQFAYIYIYLLEVCQEPPVLFGGTFRTLRVPDRRLKGQVHPPFHRPHYFTQRKIP